MTRVPDRTETATPETATPETATARALRPWWTSPYLMLVMPPLFWAGNAIAGRVAVADVSPLGLSVVRWALAILILLPFTWKGLVAEFPVIRARWRRLVVLGVLSAGLYNLFLYMALETSTAINVTLVNTAMPMAIVLVGWIWLKERPSAGGLAGIVLSMAGVAVVVSRGDPAVLLGLELHRGDLLMMVAVLVWALYSQGLKAYPPGLTAGSMLTVQMAAGLGFLLPLWLGEVAIFGGGVPMTWTMAAVYLYVAVGPAIGAFYFWNRGVAEAGAAAAGLYINLLPVFTAILAVPLLGESLHWYHGAGLALIGSGIALGTVKRRRP